MYLVSCSCTGTYHRLVRDGHQTSAASIHPSPLPTFWRSSVAKLCCHLHERSDSKILVMQQKNSDLFPASSGYALHLWVFLFKLPSFRTLTVKKKNPHFQIGHILQILHEMHGNCAQKWKKDWIKGLPKRMQGLTTLAA